MSTIPATMNGVIIDMYGRTITGPVKIVGELMYSDRGPGGGPMPPGEGGGGLPPLGIWGGPIDPYPDHGLPGQPPSGGGSPGTPPGFWGGGPHPMPPIAYPPNVPPSLQPPTTPPPGSVTPVPPPAGQAGWPVTGIVPPPYVVLQYPGVGPVYVTPPPTATPA